MKKLFLILILSIPFLCNAQLVGKYKSEIAVEMKGDGYYISSYNSETGAEYWESNSTELMYVFYYDDYYCYLVGIAGGDDNIYLYNLLVDATITDCVYKDGTYYNYSTGLKHTFSYNGEVWTYFSCDMRY